MTVSTTNMMNGLARPNVVPPPMLCEQFLVGTELIDHVVLRQNLREAARHGIHPERDNERRQVQIGDQHAVHEPAGERGQQPGTDADPDRVPGIEHHRSRDARYADDRADGEIDAFGDDDRGHAEREDADERVVARHVEEVVFGEEDVRHAAHHQADHDQRNRHPERLADEHGAQWTALPLARDLFDRDAHASSLFSGRFDGAGDETRDFFGRSLPDRLVGDDLAAPHDRYVVANREDVRHAMADQDHGDTLIAQTANEIEHFSDLTHADRGGRLVHQHDVGVGQPRARNRDGLTLAARHLPHEIARARLRFELGEVARASRNIAA